MTNGLSPACRRLQRTVFGLGLALFLPANWPVRSDEPAVPLPAGVQAVWDIAQAVREATPTRERVCLNGLWQWQPADPGTNAVPARGWGWFKVPGCWPGITDYMQKVCQTVFAHPVWRDRRLGDLTAAWYQRQITVPTHWAGRRIALRLDCLNSMAAVHVDGRPVGELRFPGGELDLGSACRPGSSHMLSLLVTALPLKGVLLSYADSAAAREVRGRVARRGLCGDAFLLGTPPGARIDGLGISTSVRNAELAVEASVEGLAAGTAYQIRAEVADDRRTVCAFTSRTFRAADLSDGRITATNRWLADRLWDVHTPSNTYSAHLTLLDAAGHALDTSWPERFGFREFAIEGRDFVLNGTRLFLSAVPIDNAQVSAGLATYAAARESLERLLSFGINLVYTHNYDCEPGAHLGFEELLRAADDVGMLVSFAQPHFSHYQWPGADADRTNGYARHAGFYVRAARNHPSVVLYSMSHNATGYNDDMNPDLIDGVHDVRDTWARRNAQRALRAEAIVRTLDPGRIVYHHASGNLGSMHPINFYPNFAPVQELSDWFEHWATTGVKPVFTCEYGAPFSWDWTLYRGWFDGKREFGSAAVPWEFCLAEWNAQFFGDRAYRISAPERANLRWEATQFRAGRLWHRWDYPFEVGSTRFDERYPVFALYLTDNWRAFRTWGVSANSPWEYGHFWKLRDGVDRRRRELPVDWAHLQRPGFSPDYVDQRYERMDLAFERSDWIATPAAQALLRNNRPLLAYLAGKAARFTSKDHLFLAGEPVEKQIVIINNSRQATDCDCAWTFALPEPIRDRRRLSIAAGQQQRIPLHFDLPPALPPGQYTLEAEFAFGTGERQTDAFPVLVLAAPQPAAPPQTLPGSARAATAESTSSPLALFDPRGETAALFDRLAVAYRRIDANTQLATNETLVLGKAALDPTGPAPDLRRVRAGLKAVVFEQSSAALEQRLGFRVAEYGLRQVFPRVADHPALDGLSPESLRDWRGEATLVPPRLATEPNPRFNGAPTVAWCRLPVTRLWRCGNRGNVASVLIEKPTRGDFLPIVDGGFSLQYSPLLACREDRGLVVFCQLDVTARTEPEPAADRLTRNLLRHIASWSPPPLRRAVYAGEPAGKAYLDAAGLAVAAYAGAPFAPNDLLIVGPDGGRALAEHATALAGWLSTSGRLLALGLDQDEAGAFLPVRLATTRAEHIAAVFDSPAASSPFAGISPAEVHNRDPRALPLITGGADVLGDGILAKAERLDAVFCQIVPWHFDPRKPANQRRTHRRVSFLVARLLANLGVAGATPLLDRFHQPLAPARTEQRWLEGLYLDTPQEWDDPYRFFRW